MRRKFVIGVVVFAALWPLAHRAMVATWDMNPWKLFGWAMYSAATPPLAVSALAGREGELVRVDADLPAAARAQLARFEKNRHVLGRALRPDTAAAAILAARPELPAVAILVERAHLDWRTGRMRVTRQLYPYPRESGSVSP